MMCKELLKVMAIAKQWENDFKGELFEDVEVDEIPEFLCYLLEEIPYFIEECIEDEEFDKANLYIDYSEKLKNSINGKKLKEECKLVNEVLQYGYEMFDEYNKEFFTDIISTIKFIQSCVKYRANKNITIEEIKDIIFHNCMDDLLFTEEEIKDMM